MVTFVTLRLSPEKNRQMHAKWWRNVTVILISEVYSVAINSFKQALYLAVATAQDYANVGIDEVGHMNVGSSVNPWETL